MYVCVCIVFFQSEDGIRDLVRSRGLGDVYKRQEPKFLKRALKGDERISLIPTIAGAGTAEWRRDIRLSLIHI